MLEPHVEAHLPVGEAQLPVGGLAGEDLTTVGTRESERGNVDRPLSGSNVDRKSGRGNVNRPFRRGATYARYPRVMCLLDLRATCHA